MTDREQCARAFNVLLNKVVAASYRADDKAALLAVQHDIVTGARRLEARCVELNVGDDLVGEVRGYRLAAEQVLQRLEQEVLGARLSLP